MKTKKINKLMQVNYLHCSTSGFDRIIKVSGQQSFRKFLILAVIILAGIHPTYLMAQCGFALNFDESKNSSVSLDPITEISNNFTMELWVKPTKTIKTGMVERVNVNNESPGISGQNYAIRPDWYNAPDPFDSDYWNSNGVYNVGGHAGAGISVGTNGIAVIEHSAWYMPVILLYYTSISSNEWTHIAVVYTNKTPALYINGSLVRTGVTSQKSYVHPSAFIGDDYGNDYGPFDGTIDELKIWEVSLSSSTIANWYAKNTTSSHPNYSDLHTYWKFNTGYGTTVYDASGNGHTGYTYYSPAWVTGWSPKEATKPDCSISASATNITLGYGEQSITLTGSGGGTYYWTGHWLNTSRGSTVVFSPGEGDGYYTISLTTKNEYECLSTCEIKICVLDYRADSEGKKIYICHVPSGEPSNSQTLAISTNAVSAHIGNHSGDKLGRCGQECSANLGKRSSDNTGTVLTVGENDLLVYPNPSKQKVFITGLKGSATILLTDQVGRIVGQYSIDDQAIPVDHLSPGMYYLMISDSSGKTTKKLRIE